MARLRKIVAGGQTGVDQAALRAGLACGLEVGGWCPPGRVCDGGIIPAELPLRETPEERSPDAPDVPRSQRTEWNVRDSDATLVLQPGRPVCDDPGTAWTVECARRLGRPVLVCDVAEGSVEAIAGWLERHAVTVLHVAGPPERVAPGVGARAYARMLELLRAVLSAGTAECGAQ